MHSKQLRNSFLLLIAATIWGTAFVAQRSGMDYLGPFAFTFLRNMIGAAVLIPVILMSKEKSESSKALIISGVLSGIALGLATCLQQYGMLYTSVGKAGFLTALYIIIVPVLGIFFKKKCPLVVWIAVVMAIIGVYLLCITEGFSINKGDIFEFLCAIAFAVQILIISKYSHRVNAYRFACIQFLTAGFFALIPMFIAGEGFTWAQIQMGWFPLVYTGVLSSGVAYTLQIVGERDLNPAAAALIMSLESCISAISAWLILGQSLSLREIIGCVIMFAAIILVQLRRD